MVRLIASDLDGTLFGADHRPAPRTVAALNGLADQGVVLVAATGRSYFGGLDRATSTGARLDWFIGSNGGHRVNAVTRQVAERLVFAAPAVSQVQQVAIDAGAGLAYEHDGWFSYDDTYLAMRPVGPDGPRRSGGPFRNHDIGKIFVASDHLTGPELQTAIAAQLPANVVATTSSDAFVEITPVGADKGAALARLCDDLSIDADDVVAFGDNHNDLTMLQWAGHSVAVANAVPAVLGVVDEVTASNLDFGVALVLERLANGT